MKNRTSLAAYAAFLFGWAFVGWVHDMCDEIFHGPRWQGRR
jgi:hypothetical protein